MGKGHKLHYHTCSHPRLDLSYHLPYRESPALSYNLSPTTVADVSPVLDGGSVAARETECLGNDVCPLNDTLAHGDFCVTYINEG
ncbi:hypothetical protein J6590_028756, partial [Homalodisca vitripennis]